MKTFIPLIFFLFLSAACLQAQPGIYGAKTEESSLQNEQPVFVQKEVQFTRTAVENLDSVFIPTKQGNAQIYVTKSGVYVVADKPSTQVSYNEPKKPIVVDLEQVKQADELINPTPNTNIELSEKEEIKDSGFNVQMNNRLNQIKTNKENPKDIITELKDRSLIDIREENIIGFIFFDANSSTIKQQYYQELYKLNYLLEQMPEAELMLIGHSDIAGSEFQNKTVAKSRAQSVYHFLVGILKMDPERFEIYAEEKNIYDVPEGESIHATNPSQKNRSVTLIVK